MSQPTVFISYSRKDEKEKDLLLSHLGVLQQAGLLDVWSDDRISVGANWEEEMDQAISQARVAILLISANYLGSEFILRKQVRELLQRRELEGITVFPVIAKACAWRQTGWLAEMSVRPKNGEPVWSGPNSHVDKELALITEEVAAILKTRSDAPEAESEQASSSCDRKDEILSNVRETEQLAQENSVTDTIPEKSVPASSESEETENKRKSGKFDVFFYATTVMTNPL